MGLTVNNNTGRITISRGDDQTIRFTVKNSAGVAYDVSSNSFKFTVKQYIDDLIGAAKFQKTSGDGIDLTDAATGIVDVNVADTDTSALAGPYVWDLEMVENTEIKTLAQGVFIVTKDVSTPGAAGSPTPAIEDFTDISISQNFYLYQTSNSTWYKFAMSSGTLTIVDAQAGPPPF